MSTPEATTPVFKNPQFLTAAAGGAAGAAVTMLLFAAAFRVPKELKKFMKKEEKAQTA